MRVLSEEERDLLLAATRVGKTVRFRLPTDSKRRRVVGQVIDEVGLIRDRHRLVVQQIRYTQHHLWDDDDVAYRLGYFSFKWDSYSGSDTEVVWRYNSVLVTTTELSFLLKQAAQKGWSIPGVF